MNVPKNLKYTKSHEWVEVMPDGKARIGITDYAQETLGNLVYAELPQEGDVFARGDNLAVVESVKASSDVYAPIAGTVAAVNEALADSPEMINDDSYGAWFVELDSVDMDGAELLSPEEYEKVLEEEE